MKFYDNNNSIALDFTNVSFSYGETNVIDSFNLEVNKGEHVCLTGKNGGGKTTILNLADALITPNLGSIKSLGQTFKKNDPFAYRKNIGYLFQDPTTQILTSKVIDDICFKPRNLGISKKSAIFMAKKIADELKISNLLEEHAYNLSDGQTQIVALAGILVDDPKILLLDEPTSKLDTEHKKIVKGALTRRLKTGTSILSASHDKDFLDFATRIVEV